MYVKGQNLNPDRRSCMVTKYWVDNSILCWLLIGPCQYRLNEVRNTRTRGSSSCKNLGGPQSREFGLSLFMQDA